MLVHTPDLQAQAAGWVLFAILAVALVALLGFLYYKKHKGNDSKSQNECVDGEAEELLPKDLLRALDDAKYVNVQLEEGENEFIKTKNNILRDAGCIFPDGDKVTCVTAVRGTSGFSSGKHYWEVSLVRKEMPPKQSWWIGVTNLSVNPKDYSHSPTADNGFWFLSSSSDNAKILQFSSNPPTCFCVSDKPQKIGVLLDYDGGKLEFYNSENKRLIGFFPTKFSGKVFPLFNPGKGDKAPMEIIQRNQEDDASEAATTNDKNG